MKDIKSYLIIENKTLSTNSNHTEIDIINAEKIMAQLLVGLTFELTFKVNKEDLGNTNLSSFALPALLYRIRCLEPMQ